jgi:hypothetical protein
VNAGVNDTGVKFAAGINDAGGQLVASWFSSVEHPLELRLSSRKFEKFRAGGQGKDTIF